MEVVILVGIIAIIGLQILLAIQVIALTERIDRMNRDRYRRRG